MKVARAIGQVGPLGYVTGAANRCGSEANLGISADGRTGRGMEAALGIVGATAALIALDPLDTPCFQRAGYQETPAIRRINRALSAGNMARVIWTVPLVFYVGGFLLRKSYAWRTGLLALEAAGDAQVVAITMKHIDRRMRPIEVGCEGDFTHTWFGTKTFKLDGAGCFPSGHTASAFAVATVFAERYPKSARAAYGAAGIVGASRISTRAHFPSDVFFGAALGYSISHFVVMERMANPDGLVTAGG